MYGAFSSVCYGLKMYFCKYFILRELYFNAYSINVEMLFWVPIFLACLSYMLPCCLAPSRSTMLETWNLAISELSFVRNFKFLELLNFIRHININKFGNIVLKVVANNRRSTLLRTFDRIFEHISFRLTYNQRTDRIRQ